MFTLSVSIQVLDKNLKEKIEDFNIKDALVTTKYEFGIRTLIFNSARW